MVHDYQIKKDLLVFQNGFQKDELRVLVLIFLDMVKVQKIQVDQSKKEF